MSNSGIGGGGVLPQDGPRLAKLLEITAAFSKALTPDEVGRVLLELGVPASNASSGSIYLLDPTGHSLELLAAVGMTDAEKIARVALSDTPMPGQDALRRREEVYLASPDDFAVHYPHLAARAREYSRKAFACFPLEVDGRGFGVLTLGFTTPQTFGEADRAFMRALAQQCAQAFERARLYEEMRQSEARLAEADRRKDEFLAILAHELRNPLASMDIAMELIRRRTAASPGIERPLDILGRQMKKLGRMMDDLLDLSRISRGKIVLEKEPTAMRDVIGRALESLRSTLDSERISISVHIDEKPGVVHGDPVRLEQVVVNLLSNAVRYGKPGGRIDVTLEVAPFELVLCIKDDGIGMSPEILERIFHLYEQANPHGLRGRAGLGIGLAIVKRLVELHGGRVEAKSEGINKGSELIVHLPVYEGARSSTTASADDAPPPEQRRVRVLVVEDDPDAREVMTQLLTSWGHQVEAASDGTRAVQMAEQLRPDVVILDIGLPAIDGYEVARRLRTAIVPAPRLLALTGFGQPRDRERAIEAGFEDHLVKPVDPGALERAVAGKR